jgi:glycosyltransferase involved in cell wall biosynthesis
MRYAWHLREEYFGRLESRLQPDRSSTKAPKRALSPLAARLKPELQRLALSPLRWARNALLDRIRGWDRGTSGRVTQFVAISRTVAQRIEECYGRASTVIHPPVDTRFYTPADVKREDFYLCVSALSPYKRIDLAIEACRRLGRRLVIIGDGPGCRRLGRLAGAHAQWLGWQPSEVIRDHLRRCRALLFPGVEDFGIVPLEAAACGTPVIARGSGGATETVLPASESSRGTGVFFAEPSADSLAAAMRRFEAHGAQSFDACLARRQAERFATERFERELIGYLRSVIENRVSSAAKLRNAA